ncbi:methylenetetrahydrofolate reductase [Pseudonocardia bannensis]|uniref:Methylenetetrahydrofolate reductase n=1 Tax=Pseudonocardia bannensis TaxID=630973 RepID=A0A848DCN6_9PSEU|nr:methylenetetrahydrofolate reductase [Pseudonocardia bannensis]NMH90369.1 5,10-methylenetetrahydrofolate reductase [Pseudonocardia bannensis]
MRGSRTEHEGVLADLLTRVRYEVIPTPSIEEKVLAAVPRHLTVTVTASPAKGLEATLALTERLRAHGYRTVPHLSARLIRDEVHLAEIVDRMCRAGVEDVFVPAGDADPPAGRYDAALPVLAELTRAGRPFRRVGITGYPESHPAIGDDLTVQAMWDKRVHAGYIVSNLCFDPAALATWIARIRRRGVILPVQLGVAGPVETAKLLATATRIGVGESTRFLTTHTSWFARLARPGGYSPERLLRRTTRMLAGPGSGVVGLHLFTFNQVAEAERWRQRQLGELCGRSAAHVGSTRSGR